MHMEYLDEIGLLRAIKEFGVSELQHASFELRGNKEVMLAVVKDNGRGLEYASKELKGDKEVVLAAVRNYAFALIYASKEIRGDKEVVLEAVRKDGFALGLASEELKEDKDFVIEAVRINSIALERVSEKFRSDKEVVLAAVRNNGFALKYASEKLRGDKEVVLAALQGGGTLGHVSKELRRDKEVVLSAVRKNGMALGLVSKELRGDEEVVLVAVRENCDALRFASEELKKSPEILAAMESQRKQHIAQEIAQGIQPTESAIQQVQDEMTGKENNNSSKDKIPILRAKIKDNKGSRGTRITDLLEKQGHKVETISIKDLMSENSTEQESKKDNVTPEGTELPEEMRIRMETLKQRELERLSQNTGEIDYPLALDSNATLEEVINQILDVESNYRMQQSDSTPLAKKNSDLQHEEKIASMIKHIEKEITGQEQSIDD